MTILLFYALSMTIDNFKFSLALTKIMLSNFVEALWAKTKCWRLRRKWFAVKIRLLWLLHIFLFWLFGTALIQVVIICNEYCWSILIAQTRQLFKVLPDYPRLFDSTLGYPGEGWKAGRQRTRNQIRKRRKLWSKEIANLSVTTWNTRSMTEERFDYCKRMHHNNAVWAKSHVTIVIVTCDDCDHYIDHHMR